MAEDRGSGGDSDFLSTLKKVWRRTGRDSSSLGVDYTYEMRYH